jgi:hypothetical protein
MDFMPNLYEAADDLSYIRDLVLLDVSGEYDDKTPLKEQLAPHVKLTKNSKTQMGDAPPASQPSERNS